MPDLLAGTTILAQDTPPNVADSQSVSGTTTSTTFTATLAGGGVPCSVVFMASTTGRVRIRNSCQLFCSAGFASCGTSVREGAIVGSGTEVSAPSTLRAIRNSDTATIRATDSFTLEGLTPGATYNARQSFVVTSGTGTFLNKRLEASPST